MHDHLRYYLYNLYHPNIYCQHSHINIESAFHCHPNRILNTIKHHFIHITNDISDVEFYLLFDLWKYFLCTQSTVASGILLGFWHVVGWVLRQ